MATDWQEKYETSPDSVVKVQEKQFADLVPGQVVVIPSPRDVGRAVSEIPSGEVWTRRQLRDRVASFHHADNACPAVTGIQLRVISEMATEALDAGDAPESVIPFWRVVEPDSNLARKLVDGRRRIEELRRAEVAMQ